MKKLKFTILLLCGLLYLMSMKKHENNLVQPNTDASVENTIEQTEQSNLIVLHPTVNMLNQMVREFDSWMFRGMVFNGPDITIQNQFTHTNNNQMTRTRLQVHQYEHEDFQQYSGILRRFHLFVTPNVTANVTPIIFLSDPIVSQVEPHKYLTHVPDTDPDPDTDDICSICLDAEENAEKEKSRLTCSHLFHTDCISSWLLCKLVCPNCMVRPIKTKSIYVVPFASKF